MPPFRLPGSAGHPLNSDSLVGQPVLVAFICNHCPYVKHIAELQHQVAPERVITHPV